MQLSAKIVYEPLTQGDGDVVAGDAERTEERVDEDKHQAANEKERQGFEVVQPRPGHGEAYEDVIDNELEGPRLRQLKGTHNKHLGDRDREAPTVGSEPLKDIARQA